MNLGIRAKFIGILILAAGAPMVAGLLSVQVVGHRYYRAEKGQLYKTIAEYLAGSLEQVIQERVDGLEDWAAIGGVEPWLPPVVAGKDPLDPSADFLAEIETIEAQWPDWDEDHPVIQAVLEHELAQAIRAFMVREPLFVEILVTDGEGRLIGASNKSSDFYQADETWWREAAGCRPGEVWLEGIDFDDSAHVYSIDVSIPLWREGETRPVGVIKGVLNATPLLASLPPVYGGDQPLRQVVLDTGEILVRLFGEPVEPFAQRVDLAAIRGVEGDRSGWAVAVLEGEVEELVGHCRILPHVARGGASSGMIPMVVLVHDELAGVLAPIDVQMRLLSLFGLSLMVVFGVSGLYIASRKLIRPVQLLERTAQGIAMSARLGQEDPGEAAGEQVRGVERSLQAIGEIRTGDEMEALAQSFKLMADRVLNYHEQLEGEITTKTEEIRRDLVIAREFQESLMPRDYPEVPDPPGGAPVALRFNHIYKATNSVGGDFFTIVKLSEHRAGVLIVDVMGHGARSALITAVLRTLVHELAGRHADPASLLEAMNRRFFQIVPRVEFIFATAFYVVFDTLRCEAAHACAGHPTPVLISRQAGEVTSIGDRATCGPALGFFEEAEYQTRRTPLQIDDSLFLYTDGLVEAANAQGDLFDFERLIDTFTDAVETGQADLCQAAMQAVNRWMDTMVAEDDICMVSVDVVAPTAPPGSGPSGRTPG